MTLAAKTLRGSPSFTARGFAYLHTSKRVRVKFSDRQMARSRCNFRPRQCEILCFLCHVFGARGAQQRPKPLVRATCSCSRCCTAGNSTRLWYDKCRLCLVELRSVCSRCSPQLCGGHALDAGGKKKKQRKLYTQEPKKLDPTFGHNFQIFPCDYNGP